MPARPAARGVAILSVITVLVALILIAIPFVISQKLGRDRTETSVARSRAWFEADLVVRAVVSYLHDTHPEYEQQRRLAGGVGIDADETVDAPDEFSPPPSYRKVISDMMRAEKGAPPPSVADPRGSIWSWKVVDANALVNPNGASPYLVGNILGSASLSDDLDAGANVIPVDSVFPTPAMGLVPFRRGGGFIRIGNETIQYASYEDGAFRGCVRGALGGDAPLRDNGPAQDHKKGDRVIDYVAYKLATHLISARPGTLTPFDTLEDLKSIQLWGGGGVLEADRFEQVRPFFTVVSRRETAEAFLDGQLLVKPLPEAASTAAGESLTMRDASHPTGNAAYFNPGVIVRISDGKNTDYTTILQAGDDKGGSIGTIVTTAGHLPDDRAYEGGRAVAEPLAPYPIDVNTASREILAAVFAGLRMRTVEDPKEAVTPEIAWDLAGKVVADRQGPLQVSGEDGYRKTGPFRSAKDFGLWIKALVGTNALQVRQGEALLRNAVNPHDNDLAFGTAPFCYRTLDVYHVEGRAVINNAAGEKEAEAALRQVVEIGADRATLWTLDSQSDFELGLSLGSGGKYFETYPFNCAFVNDGQAHVQPRRRAPQWYGRDIWPSDVRADDVGDVRLQASRIKLPSDPTSKQTLAEEMDASYYADGWLTSAAGPYVKPVKKLLMREDPTEPWMHPFTMSMWMRPFSDGNWFAFDTGHAGDQNRISIFVRDGDQGTGKELVLRVCDATLNGEGAEIYVPLQRLGYQVETWYHLQANVRGCDPAMMELFIDGLSVGRRRGLTYLTAGLSNDATTISVDDTEGFTKEGALQIGDEVVEYDTMQSDGFTEAVRGARGTKARDWPAGTAVKRLGYSHLIVLDLKRGGAGLESSQEWERWNYMQVVYDQDQVAVTVNGASVTFKGAKEDASSFSVTLKNADPNDTSDPNQKLKTFNSKGYALLAVREFDPSATSSGGGGGAGAGIGGATLASAPAAPPVPGGAGPGAGRPVPSTPATPAPPSGGTTPPGQGGSVPPGTNQGTSSSGPKIGGWEVVYYTRNGNSLTLERYQSTTLHKDVGTPFFLATRVVLPNGEEDWPARLIPISVSGTSAGAGAIEYFDPANNPEDKQKLDRWPLDGDPDASGPDTFNRPRVLVGSDSPAGSNEVICYDEIDKRKASPLLLFCRTADPSLKALWTALMTDAKPATPNELIPPPAATTTAPGGATLSASPTPPTVPGAPAMGVSAAFGPAPAVPVAAPAAPPPAGGGGGGAAGGGAPAPRPGPPAPAPGATPPPTGGGEPVPLPTSPSGGGSGGSTSGATPTPPSPGGAGPGAGREPPPDSSGGGGTPPSGPQPGGAAPPPGTRPPSDPPPPSTGGGGGGTASTLPTVDSLKVVFPFRGANGTGDRHHAPLAASDKDALLLPCFRTLRIHEDTGLPVGGPQPGFNDVVTLATGPADAPRRELRRVRWSHGLPNGGQRSDWLALTEFIEGDTFANDDDQYRVDYRGKTRMLCFPSGEMPDEHGENAVWAKNEVGGGSPVTAFLDEIFVWMHGPSIPMGLVVNGENLTEKEKEITLRAVPPATTLVGVEGYDRDCGVIDLDGELIVYRATRSDGPDTVTLSDCRRGALGTKARAHATQTYARFVPDVWVSFIDGNVNKDAAQIPLGRTRGWPKEGAARIVSDETVEIVHYTGLSETGLILPESLDADPTTRSRGLFRGRFGTEALQHENGELVVWQPFRFWDRTTLRRGNDSTQYAGMHSHPEGSYIEFAKTVRDAVWQGVTWTANLDGRTPVNTGRRAETKKEKDRRAPSKMEMLCVVRFDQTVPWDTTKVVDLRGEKPMPTDAREHPERYLFVLDSPDAPNFDVEATTAEFRVYFPYLVGAYAPQELLSSDPGDLVFENSWKNTPWLRSFSVKYRNRTKIRYSAEIR